MNTIVKSLASLVVGVLTLAVVAVVVTEALAPHVWPSAMVGLPAGLVAGAVTLPLSYLGLTYWSERRETGRAAARTRRRLWTLFGATTGFVVGGGLAMAVLSTQAAGFAALLLFAGFPVGLLSGAILGYLAYRRSPVDAPSPGSTFQ